MASSSTKGIHPQAIAAYDWLCNKNRSNHCSSKSIVLSHISLNRASVEYLVDVCRGGRNTTAHSLYLYRCTVTRRDGALQVLQSFLDGQDVVSSSILPLVGRNHDGDATQPFTAICVNALVKSLHLEGMGIKGAAAGEVLRRLLKHNKSMEILNVRNNELGNIGLTGLCDGLALNPPHLVSLKLCRCLIGSNINLGETILADSSSSPWPRFENKTVTELCLAHNFLQGTSGGRLLGRLVTSFPNLVKLNVKSNPLGPAAMLAFRQVVCQEENGQEQRRLSCFLQHIDLSDCRLDNDSLDHLVEALSASRTDSDDNQRQHDDDLPLSSSSLTQLCLADNQIQGRLGGASLGALLLQHHNSLQVMDVRDNPLLGPQGAYELALSIQRLRQASPPQEIALSKLILSGCRLGDEGVRSIVDSFVLAGSATTCTSSNTGSLKHLDLTHCGCTTKSLSSLTKLLNGIDIEELELGDNDGLFYHHDDSDYGSDEEMSGSDSNSNNKNDNDTDALYGAIAKHKSIRVLRMDGCGMMKEHEFLASLQENVSLHTVQVDTTKDDDSDFDESYGRVRSAFQQKVKSYTRRNKLVTMIEPLLCGSPETKAQNVWMEAFATCAEYKEGATAILYMIQTLGPLLKA